MTFLRREKALSSFASPERLLPVARIPAHPPDRACVHPSSPASRSLSPTHPMFEPTALTRCRRHSVAWVPRAARVKAAVRRPQGREQLDAGEHGAIRRCSTAAGERRRATRVSSCCPPAVDHAWSLQHRPDEPDQLASHGDHGFLGHLLATQDQMPEASMQSLLCLVRDRDHPRRLSSPSPHQSRAYCGLPSIVPGTLHQNPPRMLVARLGDRTTGAIAHHCCPRSAPGPGSPSAPAAW